MRKEHLAAFGKMLASAAFSGKAGTIEKRSTKFDSHEFDYQLYLPPQLKVIESTPLIVFLHGIGQRGTGGFLPTEGMYATVLRQQLSRIPAVVLLPQCRAGSYWSDPVMDKMVMRQIAETSKEFGVDENRVYLIGVSMGGYGVWHFAYEHPQKFAALVSICGGSSITKGDRFSPLAEAIGKTPAWLFHGADDQIVQVSESRQIVEALKKHQAPVKYNEYPNVGHNVWLNALAEKELIPWLLEQRRN